MNKEELIKLVDSLNWPKEEFYILGSGSLVMFGIREKANDLDLCISEELFETIKNRIDLNKKNKCGFYPVTDIVEVVVNKKTDFEYELKDGYQVERLEKILNFKINRNLPKDKVDIERMKAYLSK